VFIGSRFLWVHKDEKSEKISKSIDIHNLDDLIQLMQDSRQGLLLKPRQSNMKVYQKSFTGLFFHFFFFKKESKIK